MGFTDLTVGCMLTFSLYVCFAYNIYGYRIALLDRYLYCYNKYYLRVELSVGILLCTLCLVWWC